MLVTARKSIHGGDSVTSVLGHILFLIFINDLDIDIKSFILKFADDTKNYRNITDTSDYNELQEDINKLMKW